MPICKADGSPADVAYIRRRVMADLARKVGHVATLEERRAAVSRTIDNPAWMEGRSGYISDIVRNVIETEL